MVSNNKIIPLASIVKAGHSLQSVVAVRVVRIWAPTDLNDSPKGLEMILLDSEGSNIVATVREDISRRYVESLKEGEIRFISGFKVADYYTTGKKARINHQYKIEFGYATKVTEPTKEVQIPRHGFKFMRFNNVPHANPQLTLDVTGFYHSHGEMERIAARKDARKLDVTLKDPQGRDLVAILWEAYADEFLAFIEGRGETDKRLVIAIQFVAITRFQGVYRVQTCFQRSKLIMDAESDEITNFYSNSVEGDSSIISSDDTKSTNNSHWLTHSNSITIKDLLACSEAGTYIVVAEIADIDTFSWHYDACSKCKKKPRKGLKKPAAKVGDTCDHCLQVIEGLVQRYRLKLEAKDSTGQAWFILLDHHAREILKKSAEFMLSRHEHNGQAPEEFMKFFEREWIFKIQVQQDYNVEQKKTEYSIMGLSDDQELIAQFVKEKSCEDSSLATPKGINVAESTAHKIPKVSSGETVEVLEVSSSNSLLNCTPQKRTLSGSELKTGLDGYSATKIPKKEK